MIEIKGKQFKSVKTACAFYGVQYKKIVSAIQNNNREIEVSDYNDNFPITVCNKNYNTIYEACSDYNVNYNKVMRTIIISKCKPESAVLYERMVASV